jgi:tripartite-type tricarboxylate transporter receptor subunit TctC
MIRRTLLQTLTLVAAVSAISAHAQSFPTKPIKIVVPVAAGGGTDLLARTLGQKAGDLLGQPVR